MVLMTPQAIVHDAALHQRNPQKWIFNGICKALQEVEIGLIVISIGCGMWHRRITEYHDVEPSAPVTKPRPMSDPKPKISFGLSPFQHLPVIGPDPLPKKRKLLSVEEEVTPFTRVRLISKKSRLQKLKPARVPFTEYAAKDVGFTLVRSQPKTSTKTESVFAVGGQERDQSMTRHAVVRSTSLFLNLSASGQNPGHGRQECRSRK